MKECQLCKKCYTDEINTCPDDGMPTFHSLSGEPVLEGKYHLEKRLGQGGMGVVYCAKHAYLKTQHAIKVILPDLVGNDPQLVTRFRQEALAAAAIRHHNVVQVTDYGVAQGTMPFLVMEFVEGESLHDLLAREGKLSATKALDLMSAICAGISVAHKQGIVHRDLKPLNIMIVKNKTNMTEAVKILDFGLAKIKSGELLGSFIQAQTTGLMGSPYYMAPEQWADEDPDARADIYSLAVMLFQMLTGDVPFKGSSIPAIMKKHLTDAPPSFAQLKIDLPPQLESAIRHALEKKPANRTESVEVFIEELRNAIGYTSMNIGSITSSGMQVSSLQILTNPPQSKIFVDNVAMGESQSNGWLLLEGLQSGTHHLRVRHEGFQDWEGQVVCDGRVKQVVTELEPDKDAIPKPPALATAGQGLAATQDASGAMQRTVGQSWQTGEQSREIKSEPEKSFLSPITLAVAGISAVLLLSLLGVTAAYLSGFMSGTNTNVNSGATPSPNVSPSTELSALKAELVQIPGGKFKMGRNDGQDIEKPEHDVTVKGFWMDKTEVTNGEYFQFIKETGYNPTPSNWERGEPFERDFKLPVRFVSYQDAQAFAKWRSKRDNVTYRLPTEEEWEYAARNGGDNNLYPWGDTFKEDCAVLDQPTTEPKIVASNPCSNNKWGVSDLIGNVFEWTSSDPYLYPGSAGEVKPLSEPHKMIRGGSAYQKSKGDNAITATFRAPLSASKRDATLGFRLVRPE
jgi:eukaryotic-like serine/threonine-protein kinase